MNTNTQKPSMGVLNMQQGETKFTLSRYAPSEDIGFFVKHYWIINWDLTGVEPFTQEVVPNPCVNLIIESGKAAIYGVAKSKSIHQLQGKGSVFGVKFKPGGFYPFIKQPVSLLTGNPMEVQDVFRIDPLSLEPPLLSLEDSQMIEFMEPVIRQRLPQKDENIVFLNSIIDRINKDWEITKVDHISEKLGINKRRLQRLFEQYVGVSPKWVIKLYRLQNAAETIDLGKHRDLLKLGADLGYYDQSHFIKDFKSIIGKTPEEYARQQQQV